MGHTPAAASADAFATDVATVARIDAVTKILDVVCRSTGMGFSAVARVTEARWIACAVRDEIGFGLGPGGELDIRTTICDEIRGSSEMVVIDNVSADDRYCSHPTPKLYGFQSYISVPIRQADGRFFGTLCAIDPKPARLRRAEVVQMFLLFANLIGFHLDAQERLAASEQALADERQRSELREQFIAVLGHDLRNPIAAVQTGARLLTAMTLPETAARVATVIGGSAARMAGLVENVLDFARGRLGGGLPLELAVVTDLDETLEHVVSELRTAWPTRTIDLQLALTEAVRCDRPRVGQLFSNLLANALTHGDPTAPVRVIARSDPSGFELTVSNAGAPIPPALQARLFHPFSRASAGAGEQGLGLGLYIASEIARAHEGTIEVASSEIETRFTFRIPPHHQISGRA